MPAYLLLCGPMIPDVAWAETIPAHWYTDPKILDIEREQIFWHTWQPFAHAAKLSSPGCYAAGEIAGEPCAVVRGTDVYPDNLSSNIILPAGHDQTLTIFEWFTYPHEGKQKEVSPETVAFSDEIQQEDIRICENVQKGLASRTYDRGRYSAKRENGVYHFHQLLTEFLDGVSVNGR